MTINLYVCRVHIHKYKLTRWGKYRHAICHFPIRSGGLFAHFYIIGYWEFMINFQASDLLMKSITMNENDHHKELKILHVELAKLNVEHTKLIFKSMAGGGSLGADGFVMFDKLIEERKKLVDKKYWWEL